MDFLTRQPGSRPLVGHRNAHPLELPKQGRQLLEHAVLRIFRCAVLLEEIARSRETTYFGYRQAAKLREEGPQSHRAPRD